MKTDTHDRQLGHLIEYKSIFAFNRNINVMMFNTDGSYPNPQEKLDAVPFLDGWMNVFWSQDAVIYRVISNNDRDWINMFRGTYSRCTGQRR